MNDPPENPANPFVGPRAIEYGEPIFGRQNDTRKLTNLILANRILLLYSPSGAGKSSLIQAALLPRLEGRNFLVLPVMRVNLAPPPELTGSAGFNRYVFSVLTSLEEGRPAEERLPVEALAGMSFDQYLQRYESSRILLIFDQFEEILTADPLDREAKNAFFEQVGEALATPNRWALFAIREDYLGAMEPYQLLVPTRFKFTFRLDLLEKEAAREVIQNTAAQGGVDFKADAASRLVDDLAEVKVQVADGTLEARIGDYVEPVHLQVVCSHLWEKRNPVAAEITADEIAEIGGVDESLAFYYNQRVAQVAQESGVSQRLIRSWFENELISESGIRSPVLMEPGSSAGLANAAILKLVDAHLVRRDSRQSATWFELAHDRLIAPIRRSNSLWFERNLSVLQRQAARWQRENRPDHLLLRGETLASEETWAAGHTDEMTQEDRAFLEASQALRQKEEAAQRLEAEMRRSRLQRRFLIVVIALLVVAVASGVIAITSAVVATTAAAENGALAILNQNIAKTAQTAVAVALTAEAKARTQQADAVFARGTADMLRQTAEIGATAEADQRLQADGAKKIAQQQASLSLARQMAAQGRNYLGVDGRIAAQFALESNVITRTWESSSLLLDLVLGTTGDAIQEYGPPIPSQESAIFSVALSPDRQRLAWGTLNGYVAVWNYQEGRMEWRQAKHNGNVLSLAFSPDGKWLASGGVNPELNIWDVANGTVVARLNVTNRVYGLDFHPSQPWLAAVNLNEIRIFDTNAWTEIPAMRYPTEPDWIQDIAWSPDGSLLASAEFADKNAPNNGIVVWDASTRQKKLTFPNNFSLNSLSWSAEGDFVAAGSTDGKVIVGNVLTGKEVPTGIASTGQDVRGVAFSPDGKVLVSGGEDQAISLFSTTGYAPIGQLKLDDPPRLIYDLEFLPLRGANLLATAQNNFNTASYNAGLYLIAPENPLSSELSSGQGAVRGAAALPDGSLRLLRVEPRRLAVSELDANAQAAAGERVIFELPGVYTTTALSHEGDYLALVDENKAVLVYALPSEEPVESYPQDGAVNGLAFSASGSVLAIGDPLEIRFQKGNPGSSFSGLPPIQRAAGFALSSLAFGPRSGLFFLEPPDYLASGYTDGNIRWWNLDPFASRVFGGVPVEFNRHTSPVTSLAFSPDRSLMASGSSDNTLILWDLETRQPIGSPLVGARFGVTALGFRDDDTLLAGYEDGRLLEWDLRLQRWVEIACGLAGEPLSTDEQAQYFPNLEYRNACQR